MAGHHDAFFKQLFSDPEVAASQLRWHLPTRAREAIDWQSLALVDGSFVDEALRPRHTDLLFEVRLRAGRPGMVYLLFEHQSRTDPRMPMRLRRYIGRIWDRWETEHPDTLPFPAVVPVLLSQGPRPWTAPLRLHEVVDLDGPLAGLAPHVPDFAPILVDLALIDDEDLRGDDRSRLGLRLLKHARDVDPWPILLANLDLLARVVERRNPRAAAPFLHYLVRVAQAPPGPEVIAMLQDRIQPEVVEEALSWHEREKRKAVEEALSWHEREKRKAVEEALSWHEREKRRAAQEGREEGREEGQCLAITQLLRARFGADANTAIAHLTHADDDAIDAVLQAIATNAPLAQIETLLPSSE